MLVGNLGNQKYEAVKNIERHLQIVNETQPSRETTRWRVYEPNHQFTKQKGRLVQQETGINLDNQILSQRLYEIVNENRRVGTYEYAPGWRVGRGGTCIDCYPSPNHSLIRRNMQKAQVENRVIGVEKVQRANVHTHTYINQARSSYPCSGYEKEYAKNRETYRLFTNRTSVTTLHLGLVKAAKENITRRHRLDALLNGTADAANAGNTATGSSPKKVRPQTANSGAVQKLSKDAKKLAALDRILDGLDNLDDVFDVKELLKEVHYTHYKEAGGGWNTAKNDYLYTAEHNLPKDVNSRNRSHYTDLLLAQQDVRQSDTVQGYLTDRCVDVVSREEMMTKQKGNSKKQQQGGKQPHQTAASQLGQPSPVQMMTNLMLKPRPSTAGAVLGGGGTSSGGGTVSRLQLSASQSQLAVSQTAAPSPAAAAMHSPAAASSLLSFHHDQSAFSLHSSAAFKDAAAAAAAAEDGGIAAAGIAGGATASTTSTAGMRKLSQMRRNVTFTPQGAGDREGQGQDGQGQGAAAAAADVHPSHGQHSKAPSLLAPPAATAIDHSSYHSAHHPQQQHHHNEASPHILHHPTATLHHANSYHQHEYRDALLLQQKQHDQRLHDQAAHEQAAYLTATAADHQLNHTQPSPNPRRLASEFASSPPSIAASAAAAAAIATPRRSSVLLPAGALGHNTTAGAIAAAVLGANTAAASILTTGRRFDAHQLAIIEKVRKFDEKHRSPKNATSSSSHATANAAATVAANLAGQQGKTQQLHTAGQGQADKAAIQPSSSAAHEPATTALHMLPADGLQLLDILPADDPLLLPYHYHPTPHHAKNLNLENIEEMLHALKPEDQFLPEYHLEITSRYNFFLRKHPLIDACSLCVQEVSVIDERSNLHHRVEYAPVKALVGVVLYDVGYILSGNEEMADVKFEAAVNNGSKAADHHNNHSHASGNNNMTHQSSFHYLHPLKNPNTAGEAASGHGQHEPVVATGSHQQPSTSPLPFPAEADSLHTQLGQQQQQHHQLLQHQQSSTLNVHRSNSMVKFDALVLQDPLLQQQKLALSTTVGILVGVQIISILTEQEAAATTSSIGVKNVATASTADRRASHVGELSPIMSAAALPTQPPPPAHLLPPSTSTGFTLLTMSHLTYTRKIPKDAAIMTIFHEMHMFSYPYSGNSTRPVTNKRMGGVMQHQQQHHTAAASHHHTAATHPIYTAAVPYVRPASASSASAATGSGGGGGGSISRTASRTISSAAPSPSFAPSAAAGVNARLSPVDNNLDGHYTSYIPGQTVLIIDDHYNGHSNSATAAATAHGSIGGNNGSKVSNANNQSPIIYPCLLDMCDEEALRSLIEPILHTLQIRYMIGDDAAEDGGEGGATRHHRGGHHHSQGQSSHDGGEGERPVMGRLEIRAL